MVTNGMSIIMLLMSMLMSVSFLQICTSNIHSSAFGLHELQRKTSGSIAAKSNIYISCLPTASTAALQEVLDVSCQGTQWPHCGVWWCGGEVL